MNWWPSFICGFALGGGIVFIGCLVWFYNAFKDMWPG